MKLRAKKIFFKNFVLGCLILVTSLFAIPAPLAQASISAGTIDNTFRYAWGENIGWVDFGSSTDAVTVTDTLLTGGAYGENIGWLVLDPVGYGGVTNDGEGNLAGEAWGENIGWVDFSQVVIGADGVFTGQAYGENIGWITFGTSTENKVQTDWRPQSARLTISGTLYEADRTTPQSATTTVTVVLGTATTTYSTTTEATTGTFSLALGPGLLATGTPVTLYVDNDASIKAVTVTKTSGTTTIPNLDLYRNHVVVRNEGTGTTTTINDLYTAADSEYDSDIEFTASSTFSMATITASTLLVASGTTFHINAPLTTQSFEIATTATALASSSIILTGNYTNRGLFTAGTATTTFASTSAQTATGTMTGTSALGNMAFSGSGTKTFGANASTTNFTVQSGSGEVVTPTALTVAGAYSNQSTTTMAGATWTGYSAAEANSWYSVTYGNGLFVAVSYDGTNRVMTSPDGITWTARTAAEANSWYGVTYGNGLFVAVAGDGTNRVMTSPDGITWTARSAAEANSWLSVTYGNGLFVAVACGVSSTFCNTTEGGNRVMTSSDGVTWTARAAAGANSWRSVTYGNGLFVAVARSGTNLVMTSSDGVTWNARTAAEANSWWSVTYGNGLFVAVSYDGTNRVMTSPDGIIWTARPAAEASSWYGVTYGNGLFVAVAYIGTNRVMTSPDGITWTARAASDANNWNPITYGNGRFVALAYSGTNRVMTSSDTTLFLTGANVSATGTLSGASQLRDVRVSGEVTFGSVASTTNLTITSGASTTLPSKLSLAGNYTNSGTLNAGSGTVYLSGSNPQTLSGTMTATSSFNNLYIQNNSRLGTTTFDAAMTAASLTAEGSTYIALKSGATTTVGTLTLNGSSTAPIRLSATATTSSSNFVLTGSETISYTTISYSNACGSTGGSIDVSTGNNTDGGNTTCWNFGGEAPTGSSTISMSDSYVFSYQGATTTLGTITITDGETPTITTANDIRLTIATSTTNFRFDTSVTTPTFGGTASGKVSGTVSYEDNGATLLISVTENFAATNTLTIAGIKVGSFATVSASPSTLELHTDGTIAGTPADTSTETFRIVGTVTVAEHTAGQADNEFSWQNRDDVTLYAFNLTPNGESATTTDLVLTLRGVNDLETSDLTNLSLYLDNNADGVLDGGDSLLDGAGILTLNGQHGAITFSADFAATTIKSYIITGDTTTIMPGASVVFTLPATGLTATGVTSSYQPVVTATVSSLQHIRNVGGGGSNARVGGQSPAGGSTETGGETGGGGNIGQEEDGANIAYDPDFRGPTGTLTGSIGDLVGEWSNGTNALASDGVYATAASQNLRQDYYNFGFGIPSGNTITGIVVKVDSSGTTAAGTIDVALSWDAGSSFTTAKATPTLSGTDIVYLVGGASDLWSRTWTPSEFTNANFVLRVTAQTSSNTLRLDALEVRVYHQATGGGGGGGGRI